MTTLEKVGLTAVAIGGLVIVALLHSALVGISLIK